MGWWKVASTDSVIGDEPLDALGAAASKVVADYQAAFNRRPTKAEWEALLHAVLGAEEEAYRVMDEGAVTRVHLEVGSAERPWN